jgi:nucleoside-diphosphate-sugar epimerase
MKVFVTGGTGMTGARLLLKLLEKGYDVVALKRESSNIDTVKKIFINHSETGAQLFEKIHWFNADLTDYTAIKEAMTDAEIVYHTAAMVSFKPKDKNRMIFENVKGTANIVNACIENKVKKLCHVSSVAALGDLHNGEELTEETEKTDFDTISEYAVSKYRSEKEVWRGMAEGLNAVIVNPSVILGTGNWNAGSPRMIKAQWEGLSWYTTGHNGFVDVEDVVNVMIILAESDIRDQRFIVSAENLPFREVFDMIADNLNKKRPNKKAGVFLLHSLKTFDNIRYFFTGKEPRLTKHTLRSSIKIHTCSNKKLLIAINYQFKPVKKSIEEICTVFLKDHQAHRIN